MNKNNILGGQWHRFTQSRPSLHIEGRAVTYLNIRFWRAEFAHQQGAHFIEQDVVLTKDGVPIASRYNT